MSFVRLVDFEAREGWRRRGSKKRGAHTDLASPRLRLASASASSGRSLSVCLSVCFRRFRMHIHNMHITCRQHGSLTTRKPMGKLHAHVHGGRTPPWYIFMSFHVSLFLSPGRTSIQTCSCPPCNGPRCGGRKREGETQRGESVTSRATVGGARVVFRRTAPVGLTESETHALLAAAKRHHGSLH